MASVFFASACATISALIFSPTYILRSRAFSASSSFIRAISDTSIPRYLLRQLQNVAVLTPSSRQISAPPRQPPLA